MTTPSVAFPGRARCAQPRVWSVPEIPGVSATSSAYSTPTPGTLSTSSASSTRELLTRRARLACRLLSEHEEEERLRREAEDQVVLRPWREGSTGKVVVYADGTVITSEDDAGGEPQFESIKDARQRRAPVALIAIEADGSCDAHTATSETSLARCPAARPRPTVAPGTKPSGERLGAGPEPVGPDGLVPGDAAEPLASLVEVDVAHHRHLLRGDRDGRPVEHLADVAGQLTAL